MPPYSTVLLAPKVFTIVVPVTIPVVPARKNVAPFTTWNVLLVAIPIAKPPLLKTPLCTLMLPSTVADVTAPLMVTVARLLVFILLYTIELPKVTDWAEVPLKLTVLVVPGVSVPIPPASVIAPLRFKVPAPPDIIIVALPEDTEL